MDSFLSTRAMARNGLLSLLLFLAVGQASVTAQSRDSGEPSQGPEETVRSLYELVTFPRGVMPDWERARQLFLPEAVVILRTSRTETAVFSVDGWVRDFVDFIENAGVGDTGFAEEIVRTHSTVFGNIAQVWVLYEAGVPGSGRPPQAGVDSFHLVRREGVWLIASILNEIPALAGPVPDVLRGEGGSKER